jgi:hypothetical protein
MMEMNSMTDNVKRNNEMEDMNDNVQWETKRDPMM